MRVPLPDPVPPLSQLRRVHLVGIGGAGLSGIARIMLARGIAVSGSDASDSPTLEALRRQGARCEVGHAAEHLGDAEVVVVSTAVREDNPEVVEAERRAIPLWSRAAALVSCMSGYRVLAVAGTHGKTTTTSTSGAPRRPTARPSPTISTGSCPAASSSPAWTTPALPF